MAVFFSMSPFLAEKTLMKPTTGYRIMGRFLTPSTLLFVTQRLAIVVEAPHTALRSFEIGGLLWLLLLQYAL
jgi:hypothetical protein